MAIRQLVLFVLLFFLGQLKAQYLSTVFIDTVLIVLDNKIIYENNTTILKFVPNNRDTILTVYNDTTYKLILKLTHLKSNNYSHLSFSGPELYVNDKLYSSHYKTYSKHESCSETDILIESMSNLDFKNPKMLKEYKANVYCRLLNIAPIDTSNYLYNYREGLWIGASRGVKFTVNYKNDKKHGLATAYYDNDVTYNVNFNNNYADNYGKGYWKNYNNRNKLKSFYPIPNIISLSCDSIKTYSHESFYLSKGEKIKEILQYRDLSIHYKKRGLKHDSIEFRARGDFMNITNDSIVILTDKIEVHDFYKKNTDTLHNFYKTIENGFLKIPINDISKIYYTREQWKQISLQATLLSILSAAVISPLVSIQKKGFNAERFRNVSLTSLGVMTLSISFGIGFSQKEYLLKPTQKSSKTWKIKYDAYR